MDMPNLSKAIRTVEVDGRIYFDLEQLLEMMFEAANNSSVAATETKDPALGIMVMGMVSLCQALDGVLTAKQAAVGLDSEDRSCSRSKVHPGHLWFLARKTYKCGGVAYPCMT